MYKILRCYHTEELELSYLIGNMKSFLSAEENTFFERTSDMAKYDISLQILLYFSSLKENLDILGKERDEIEVDENCLPKVLPFGKNSSYQPYFVKISC